MKQLARLTLLLLSISGVLWCGASSPQAGNAVHGQEIYDQLCWRCHGRSGKSDGPVSEAMNPRPRDLTDRTYMSGISDEDLLNVIKQGGAGVGKSPAMMAFKDVLSDEDIRDLVAYLRTLCCQ
jgi:cytochrome c oxidase cbb3-type subunit 3